MYAATIADVKACGCQQCRLNLQVLKSPWGCGVVRNKTLPRRLGLCSWKPLRLWRAEEMFFVFFFSVAQPLWMGSASMCSRSLWISSRMAWSLWSCSPAALRLQPILVQSNRRSRPFLEAPVLLYEPGILWIHSHTHFLVVRGPFPCFLGILG